MPVLLDELNASAIGSFELVKKEKIYTLQTRFTRSYYVLSDNIDQDEADAVLTPGIPPIGSIILNALAKSQKVKELDRVHNPLTNVPAVLFQVDVEFDSEFNEDDADESDTPPEQRRPKVSWGGELEEEVLDRDVVTGDAIVTTAGERLIVTHTIVLPILTVKRYVTFPFDPDTNLLYANHVNSTEFWGAPRGSALMLPVQVEEADVEGTKYDLATYQVKFKLIEEDGGGFKQDTWQGSVLNQGNWYLEDGKRVRATDDGGREIKVNLNTDGTRREDDEEDPTYVEFKRFGYANLNDLDLGPF